MIKKIILLIGLLVTLCACTHKPDANRNPYCLRIKHELHAGSHRHTMYGRVTAIKRAKLMEEAQAYHCDLPEGNVFVQPGTYLPPSHKARSKSR